MKKSSKTALILCSVLALALSGGAFALLFARHGTESYARFSDLYEDPSAALKDTGTSFLPTELAQELEYRKTYEKKGTSFTQGSFFFTDYSSYDKAAKALNQRIVALEENFFSSYSLLGIYREGSFFSESVTGKAKYSDGTFSVTYYVEDQQPLSGQIEKTGVYYVDFFRLDRGSDVSKVVLSDHLF